MATRGSTAWRLATWGAACHPDIVAMAIYAGGPRFQCDRRARESFTRLGAVFLRHGYVIRTAGCYNCRRITGGTTPSSHSWGTSLDVNEDTNPYRLDKLVTDIPRAVIADVYAIKTSAGVQVFRWGGDWDGRPDTRNSNYDAMHFEIIATPEELLVGFTLDVPSDSPGVLDYPVIRRGAKGSAVVELQKLLSLGNTTGVGEFGPRTEMAVTLYQQTRGLVVDGIVGHGTWTALLTHQPPVAVSGASPRKAA